MKRTFKVVSLVLSIMLILSMIPSSVITAFAEDLQTEQTSETDVSQSKTGAESVGASEFEYSKLNGKVVDENGDGISDVNVRVHNTDEDITFTPMLTNENGEWSLSGYDIISGYTYEIWYAKTCYNFSKAYLVCVAENNSTVIEEVTGTHFELPGYVCYEDDYTYSVSDDRATITKYNGVAENILIPDKLGGYPVVSIGSEAFKNNKTIKKVYCSELITTIGSSAFYNCTNLTDIRMSNLFTTIGSFAFYSCSGLTTVTLPDSVTTINGSAFRYCSNLERINYPMSWKNAYEYIFSGCTKLTSITVPEGVTTIPSDAFYDATYIENIELPSTLTTIGSFAFRGCTGLTEITLPDSVTTINGSAFRYCSNLERINYPMSWKNAYENIFNGCTKLTSITIPEGVTSIPSDAFYCANGLREVYFLNTLTNIGSYAFYGCSKLRGVNTQYGIKTIGNSAFRECSKLLAITLPDSVETIGDNCFSGCNMLSVYCSNTSKISTYLIDKNIPINLFDTDATFLQNRKLKQEGSYYIANTVSARANGFVTMNLAYDFKDEVKSTVSGLTLKIRTPSNSTLIEKTLMLDGVRMTGYDYNNNLLTVALSKTSGTISFDISPTSDSKLSSYALLTFKCDGTNMQEIIGVINEDIPHISIQSDDEVSTQSVEIKGVGPSDSDVSLYVDGELSKTVHTNKSGSYETVVSLSNPKTIPLITSQQEH